jgi:hypothetical protein
MARTLVSTIGPVADSKVAQIGDIVHSMLSEAQFQAERDGTWVLADGRSVIGDEYETITGNANIPDLRGKFLRGKNNGTSTTEGNASGEVNLGTAQTDEFRSHNHTQSGYILFGNGNFAGGYFQSGGQGHINSTVSATGGAETRPKNVTVNYFIKIN